MDLNEERKSLNRLASEDYKASNIYQLDLIRLNYILSIFLYYISFIKIYNLIVVLSSISILLQMLQLFNDYIHAQNWGDFRQKIANNIADRKYKNYKDYYVDYIKSLKRFKVRSIMWPFFAQMIINVISIMVIIFFYL